MTAICKAIGKVQETRQELILLLLLAADQPRYAIQRHDLVGRPICQDQIPRRLSGAISNQQLPDRDQAAVQRTCWRFVCLESFPAHHLRRIDPSGIRRCVLGKATNSSVVVGKSLE